MTTTLKSIERNKYHDDLRGGNRSRVYERVAALGFSKELHIKATNEGNTIQVEISQ